MPDVPPGQEIGGLQPRVDVDLGARAGVKLPGEGLRRPVQADEDRGERPWVHPAVRVMLDGGRQARGRAEYAHRGDVVQRDLPAVDQARLPRQADVNDPAARLGEPQGKRGDRLIAGAVDDRVVVGPAAGPRW